MPSQSTAKSAHWLSVLCCKTGLADPAKRNGFGPQKRNGVRPPFRFKRGFAAIGPFFTGVRLKPKRNGCFSGCHWESVAPRPPVYVWGQEGPVNSVGYEVKHFGRRQFFRKTGHHFPYFKPPAFTRAPLDLPPTYRRDGKSVWNFFSSTRFF